MHDEGRSGRVFKFYSRQDDAAGPAGRQIKSDHEIIRISAELFLELLELFGGCAFGSLGAPAKQKILNKQIA